MTYSSIPEEIYFHGDEINHFIHIQIPMELIVSDCFKDISGNAKILYGLLLNRTGLSLRNGWQDKNNRAYINYSIEDVMADLHISKSSASRLFSELTNIREIKTKNGKEKIGLVEKVRILNKPSRIYVLKVDVIKKLLETDISAVDSDMTPRSTQICDHGEVRTEAADVPDMTSPSVQERVEKNNNNCIYHNNINIYPINQNSLTEKTDADDTTEIFDEKKMWKELIKVQEEVDSKRRPVPKVEKSALEEMNAERELIRNNINYYTMFADNLDRDCIDDLVETMVEAIVLDTEIRIKDKIIPRAIYKEKFEQMDYYQILTVKESLSHLKKMPVNIKQYMLVTLYNSAYTTNSQLVMDLGTWM